MNERKGKIEQSDQLVSREGAIGRAARDFKALNEAKAKFPKDAPLYEAFLEAVDDAMGDATDGESYGRAIAAAKDKVEGGWDAFNRIAKAHEEIVGKSRNLINTILVWKF